MHKKFEINRTKIKGGCQLGRKAVTYNSKSNLPLAIYKHEMKMGSLATFKKQIPIKMYALQPLTASSSRLVYCL